MKRYILAILLAGISISADARDGGCPLPGKRSMICFLAAMAEFRS